MWKVILIIFILASCSLEENKQEYITKDIVIKNSGRAVIGNLDSPKMNYILEKDGEEYLNVTDYPLEKIDGVYSFQLKLISNSSYKFTKFDIVSESKIIYILDIENLNNNNGFNVGNDILDLDIVIYLKRVDMLDFDDINVQEKDIQFSLDESSTIGYIDLTFKVSSNIPNAEFKVYMYSVYWKLGATLTNNGVFDMDTGKEYSPLEDGDNEAWGKGKFKIETTNTQGEVISITGTTEEWSKKHIVLTL